MKLITPDYYKGFACIAERCKHSCCIGWEIDIDPDTYEYYKNIPGEFGDRLRCGISCGDSPCFKLGDGERCVFLNDRGLCDIILNLGEDSLCDICTLHPRFQNVFSDRTEMGLGLCCEEACRIILGQTGPMRLIVAEDDGEGTVEIGDSEFFEERDDVFGILQDRTASLEERFSVLSERYGIAETVSPDEWAKFYRDLERLDPVWDKCLDILENKKELSISNDLQWENLAVYILYRHSSNYSVSDAVSFAIHTVKLLCTISEQWDTEDLCRIWSSEIEYSEENTDAIVEKLAI